MLRTLAAAALGVVLACTVVHEAWGQAKKEPAKQAAAAKPPIPDGNQLAILIQSAVVAAAQANATNNYTVLHALAAPGFQKDNPPEKLAQTFAEWRSKKVDLTPVIIFSPILKTAPAINANNMLHLTGYYKTEPLQVHFELLYQPVAGHWRLFGIALSALPAQAAAAAKGAPPADKKKAEPAAKK
jgi:hypothetical protein